MPDPDPILTIVWSRQTEFANEAAGVVRLPARWWRHEPAAQPVSDSSLAAVVPLSGGAAAPPPGVATAPPPGIDPDPGPEAA